MACSPPPLTPGTELSHTCHLISPPLLSQKGPKCLPSPSPSSSRPTGHRKRKHHEPAASNTFCAHSSPFKGSKSPCSDFRVNQIRAAWLSLLHGGGVCGVGGSHSSSIQCLRHKHLGSRWIYNSNVTPRVGRWNGVGSRQVAKWFCNLPNLQNWLP